jgi:hypothetical protein
MRSTGVSYVLAVLCLYLVGLVLAPRVEAQFADTQPPWVMAHPSSSTVTSSSVAFVLDWCDDHLLRRVHPNSGPRGVTF